MTFFRSIIARFACGFALNASVVCGVSRSAVAAEPNPPGRVLFIGIDGCRFDALERAETPNLDRLRADGCYSDRTLIQGERYRGSNTVSGPGWSSLLTGVWADKHGVDDNRFHSPKLREFPHFFVHLKSHAPRAKTISIASWPPISEHIVRGADVDEHPSDQDLYVPGDRETTALAAKFLLRDDPTAMFVYFGQVDEHGHKFGFSPEAAEYVAAIERVDLHVCEVVAALRKRPGFTAENWLVLVSSDHGGRGKDHGGGRDVPEIMNSFVIVSGAAAERGKIETSTFLVDVPVTALAHLGIELRSERRLDGRPIGLRVAASAVRSAGDD